MAKTSDQCVGMLYNIRLGDDLSNQYIPWVCRSWIMDKAFKKENLKLFIYSPSYTDPKSGLAKGYFINNNQYVWEEREVPLINYWHLQGADLDGAKMSRRDFVKWTQDKGILNYPVRDMLVVASDKYRSYLAIKKYSETIQPKTEKYDQGHTNLYDFFDHNDLIFLKPSHGNHSKGIITIERSVNIYGSKYYLFNHYMSKERQEIYFTSFAKLARFLEKTTHKGSYAIQTGIRTMRYNGSSFVVRVVTVHDGREWQWVHHVRVGAHFSAIPAYPFFGKTYPLKEIFLNMVKDEDTVSKLIGDLRSAAFGIVQYFDSLYPGEIGELAFDFIVGEDYKIYLAEINTHPAMVGDPETVENFFQASFYGEQAELYVSYLAKFFKKKLE